MASYTKFDSFGLAMAHKLHDLETDSLVVALCNAANAPVAGDSQLSDLTVVAYTNLSSRVLSQASSSQTSGTYKLVLDDLALTASGGAVAAFRYVVIYNDTATNDELIAFYDYGSDQTLLDGEIMTLDFSPTNGVLQLA